MRLHQMSLIGCASLAAMAMIASPTFATTNQEPAATPGAQSNNGGASHLVTSATAIINKMKSNTQVDQLLKKAKGLYVVPSFGHGGLIVGGRGGAGFVVFRQGNQWTSPAFFDIGGISLGAQAGISAGPVVFILMTNRAAQAFKSGNNFSLNANAGLSIVRYSANAQASWGKGDIILWTHTSGAYAGATISATDIGWDSGNNKAFYGRKVTMSQILSDKVSSPKAQPLQSALPV